MLNSVILIGRLVETPILGRYKDTEYTNVVLAVNRPFKATNGEDEADFIRVAIWNAFARATCGYCRKGDIIAIRGRIASKSSEVKFEHNGEILKKKISTCDVVGERVIFIQVNGVSDKKVESSMDNDLDVLTDEQSSES